ncbi:hypothetical protein [Streptomyces sp. NPDC060205]|uniref:hypothetical protein n=1 Tax=Streptomyces sp. NPDC060205 TaxID=3347072 RepID=UPI0036686EBC
MDTAAGPGFDTAALRRGIEDQDATALLSLYAADGELRDGRLVEQTVPQARDAEE